MNNQNNDFQAIINERLLQLPQPVRTAITSADIQKRLRILAETQKLHLDEWELLENEVMLALLGFQKIEDLEINIRKAINIDENTARGLAENINTSVFEPIREELERQLAHPEAKEKEVSGVEAARGQIVAESQEVSEEMPTGNANNLPPAPPTTAPTPPPPPPEEKIAPPPAPKVYTPGQTSTARADVHNDPYREPPL